MQSLFLLLVDGGEIAIGYLTAPGERYSGLPKPSFNPQAKSLDIFDKGWLHLRR
jgi:hypothetical protein